MRITSFFTLALLSCAAQATPVTVKVAVNVASYFDYPTRTYMSMPSVSGIVSFTFDADQVSVTDYGTTTISTFGGTMGTAWSSPLTAHIPSDPATGAYGPFYNSYVFPNVSDYPSTFIEEGAAQANTYRSNGVDYAAYHIELRATRRSAPRAGDGSADYAFDRSTLLDFYRSFALSGESVYFNESYENYTFVAGTAVYSDGKSWSDYSARVIDVIDHAASVPEPSTALLLIPGLIALTLRASGRQANLAISNPSRGA